MNIIIIGAGAAGCFAAIEIKRRCPEADVTILEKGKRALAKVAITGGGRCNLTNSFARVRSLEQVYPRGHRLMKKLFHHFSHEDTMRWFQQEGVRLVTQDDECVFPQSQDAMEIVRTLLYLIKKYDIHLHTGKKVNEPIQLRTDSEGIAKGYHIHTDDGAEYTADKVLVTIGGQPHDDGFSLLKELDIEIIKPEPSLFSLCIENESLRALMGTVVENAAVSLIGTKIRTQGPLLITHWGVSGPAVLKLSSIGARILAEKEYQADININWLSEMSGEDITDLINDLCHTNREKKVSSVFPTEFNSRLWSHLLSRAKISSDMRWKELSSKDINRLINTLTNDTYHVTGKNRFKDEFVTSGGVSLSALHHDTLESKKYPGLFFAGEATDVDAITGGFNLQAAWTMGYVAAVGMCRKES